MFSDNQHFGTPSFCIQSSAGKTGAFKLRRQLKKEEVRHSHFILHNNYSPKATVNKTNTCTVFHQREGNPFPCKKHPPQLMAAGPLFGQPRSLLLKFIQKPSSEWWAPSEMVEDFVLHLCLVFNLQINCILNHRSKADMSHTYSPLSPTFPTANNVIY